MLPDARAQVGNGTQVPRKCQVWAATTARLIQKPQVAAR